jgi:hypothetical protein
MSETRKIAEETARAWAKSELYLYEPLHAKSMERLVGAIEGAVNKALAGEQAPGNVSGVFPGAAKNPKRKAPK